MDGKANNGPEIGENKINTTNFGETDLPTGAPRFVTPLSNLQENRSGGVATLERPSTHTDQDHLQRIESIPAQEPLNPPKAPKMPPSGHVFSTSEEIHQLNTYSREYMENVMKAALSDKPAIDEELFTAANTGKTPEGSEITPDYQRQAHAELEQHIQGKLNDIDKREAARVEEESKNEHPNREVIFVKSETGDNMLSAREEDVKNAYQSGHLGRMEVLKERSTPTMLVVRDSQSGKEWVVDNRLKEISNVMHIEVPQGLNRDKPEDVQKWLNDLLYQYEIGRVEEFDATDIHYIEQTINQEMFRGYGADDPRLLKGGPKNEARIDSETGDAYRRALIDQVKMRNKLHSAKFRIFYNIKDAAAIASSLSNDEATVFHREDLKLRSGRTINNPFQMQGIDEALKLMENDYGIYFRAAGRETREAIKENLTKELDDKYADFKKLSPDEKSRRVEITVDLAEKEMLLYGESAYYDGMVLDFKKTDETSTDPKQIEKWAKVDKFVREVEHKLRAYDSVIDKNNAKIDEKNREIDRKNVDIDAENTRNNFHPGDKGFKKHLIHLRQQEKVEWSPDRFISEEVLRIIYDAPAVHDPTDSDQKKDPSDSAEKTLNEAIPLEELMARFTREEFDLLDFGADDGSGGSLGGSGPRNGKRSFYWGVYLEKPGGEEDKEKGQASWLRRIAFSWVTSAIRRTSIDSPSVERLTDMVEHYFKPEQGMSQFTSKLTTWGSILANQGEAREIFVRDAKKSILQNPLVHPERLTHGIINGYYEDRHKTIAEIFGPFTEAADAASAGLRIAAQKKMFANALRGVLVYEVDRKTHYKDGFNWESWDRKTRLAVIEYFLHEKKINYHDAHEMIHELVGSPFHPHFLGHALRNLNEEAVEHILKRFFKMVFTPVK